MSPMAVPERGIMSRFSSATLNGLSGLATRRSYYDGQSIHQRGDDRAGVDLIWRGMVRLGAVGKTGHTISTSLLRAGDMYGEMTVFASIPRMQDAYAIGETIVDHVPASRFRQALRDDQGLVELLLEMMARRQARALREIDDILRRPLIERLARQLLDRDRFLGRTGLVDTGKNDLAEALGASRVAISNALSRLGALGYVRSGYNKVEILDADGLESWLDAQGDSLAIAPRPSLTD